MLHATTRCALIGAALLFATDRTLSANVFTPESVFGGADIVAPDPLRVALPGPTRTAPSPLALCFAPGTDPAYMARINQWVLENSNPNQGERYFATTRWPSPPDIGSPVFLTYSFPADTLDNIGGGATTQNVLNAKMAQWFGSVANGKARFRVVFDRWEQLSGARFTEVPDDNAPWGSDSGAPLGQTGPRGDIRIVSINIDGGGGVLAFNFFPVNGDMVLDSSENYGSASNNNRFFRNVAAHENGHGMGLAHSCPQNSSKLMEPGLNTNFDGPQQDDIRGMQKNYGDRYLSNNTPATGGNLGVLDTSLIVVTDLSIDINMPFQRDVDWFRFTMPSTGTVTIRVAPTGTTYPNGPQVGNECTTTGNVDALLVQDMAFSLYDSDTTTPLITVSAAGLGQPELLSDYDLSSGTHYIRIFSTLDGFEVQMYRLEVQAGFGDCFGDVNADGVVDFTDLSWVLNNYGVCGVGIIGDINNDGCVDFTDFSIVLANYGNIC